MGMARTDDIDVFLDDADGDDSNGYDLLPEERRSRKPARQRYSSWRSIEDHAENRRLRRELADFYDDDFDA